MTAASFRSTPTICFTAPACPRATEEPRDRRSDRGADLCAAAAVAGRLFRVPGLRDDEREHQLWRSDAGDRDRHPGGDGPVVLARLSPAAAAAWHRDDRRVTGGQIAALIFALLLLLPGGCGLVVGIGMLTDSQLSDTGGLLLVVGIVILAVMGLLFWLAFRKRPPPGVGNAP